MGWWRRWRDRVTARSWLACSGTPRCSSTATQARDGCSRRSSRRGTRTRGSWWCRAKCGEQKCGEQKCGEQKCGEEKCGELKCGEQKCGEQKCGEQKCGELEVREAFRTS